MSFMKGMAMDRYPTKKLRYVLKGERVTIKLLLRNTKLKFSVEFSF